MIAIDAVPVAAPCTPSRARANSSIPTSGAVAVRTALTMAPEEAELVQPAVPEEVAGLAEERRGDAEGQQRTGRGPGQHREVRVEVRLDRGQGDDEDGEGDVEGEQPGQQRDEGPPLVARAAHRPGRDPAVQQDEPVRLDRPVPPAVPMAPPPGSNFGSSSDVGLLGCRASPPGTPYRCRISRRLSPATPTGGRDVAASAQPAQAEPPVRVAAVGVEVVRGSGASPGRPTTRRRRSGHRPPGSAGPACGRASPSGGVGPWCFHTTMGTPHTSQSATQHTSSSWCHSERRAASQRSQAGSNGSATAGGQWVNS